MGAMPRPAEVHRGSGRLRRVSSTAAGRHAPGSPFRIALFVPISGSAGLWGPSSIACAQLAAEELNQAGGLRGRSIHLSVFNAADEADDLLAQAGAALADGDIDAIVGMHTSSVRQVVKRAGTGDVPFVYTPLYEGGETAPGVFAIGERPEQQLRPAIRAMERLYGARRWMLLGNDYIWPRVSHRLAHDYIREMGGEVVQDLYLPFGVDDFQPVFDRIARHRPQAILMSLIGQDAIDFNRLFGAQGCARNTLRLSCAVEENGLLAIGADNTDGLHVASGYFASLGHEANLAFKERYYGRYGSRAPTLNALGQSTYEGVHFVAALTNLPERDAQPVHAPLARPLSWRSVRGTRFLDNRRSEQPVYLARAQGHLFEIIQAL